MSLDANMKHTMDLLYVESIWVGDRIIRMRMEQCAYITLTNMPALDIQYAGIVWVMGRVV